MYVSVWKEKRPCSSQRQLSPPSQEAIFPRAPGLVAPEFGIQTKVKWPARLPIQHCSALSAPRKEPGIQQPLRAREEESGEIPRAHQVVVGLWDKKQKIRRRGEGREGKLLHGDNGTHWACTQSKQGSKSWGNLADGQENFPYYSSLLLQTKDCAFCLTWKQRKGLTLL